MMGKAFSDDYGIEQWKHQLGHICLECYTLYQSYSWDVTADFRYMLHCNKIILLAAKFGSMP